MARVLFFGRLRELAGAREMDIEADTLAALRARLAEQSATLGEALDAPGVSVAIDKVLERGDRRLTKMSEVAFMPPLSGG